MGRGPPGLRPTGPAPAQHRLGGHDRRFRLHHPRRPPLALILLSALAGLTVSSWNESQLAEVAREAPKGRVGETTSGATLVIFVGYVVGPTLFAFLLAQTGGYRLPFLVTAALSLAAALALWPRSGASPSS